jgi:hypothetical protein
MQRKRVVSEVAAAAVLMAVAVTSTACSSSGTAGGSGDIGKPAAAPGGDAGAQGLTLLAKMTAPQAVATSSKAVSSKQSAKVHLTLTMPTLSETLDGTVGFGAALKMDTTMSMKAGTGSDPQVAAGLSQMGTMGVRMLDSVAYMEMGKNPQIAAALQGKTWVKLDFANLDQIPALKSMSFVKDVTKNTNPAAKLDTLLAAPDLKMVGTEQHNGVQTLHYSGTVSLDDMLKASAAGTGMTQQDLDDARTAMQKAGVTKTGYDVWVDGGDLPVEVKFSEDTSAGAVSGDLTYSDWGTPVSVTAPPADQTVDFVKLMNGLKG